MGDQCFLLLNSLFNETISEDIANWSQMPLCVLKINGNSKENCMTINKTHFSKVSQNFEERATIFRDCHGKQKCHIVWRQGNYCIFWQNTVVPDSFQCTLGGQQSGNCKKIVPPHSRLKFKSTYIGERKKIDWNTGCQLRRVES